MVETTSYFFKESLILLYNGIMESIEIKEKRYNIFTFLLAILIVALPICSLFYGIITSNYISWKSFQINDLFLAGTLIVLLGIGSLLCVFKIIELLYKLIFPQYVILSKTGININKTFVAWNDIEDIRYLKFQNLANSLFNKILMCLLLIITLRFETLIKLFLAQQLLRQQKYGMTISILLKNGKNLWLPIDENLCFRDLIEINKTENYVNIVTKIKDFHNSN